IYLIVVCGEVEAGDFAIHDEYQRREADVDPKRRKRFPARAWFRMPSHTQILITRGDELEQRHLCQVGSTTKHVSVESSYDKRANAEGFSTSPGRAFADSLSLFAAEYRVYELLTIPKSVP